MSSSLLRTLLLPLLVAAALLPRGVRLEWCICEASGPVSCCEPASCCDAPAKEPSAEDAREGAADCAERFNELLLESTILIHLFSHGFSHRTPVYICGAGGPGIVLRGRSFFSRVVLVLKNVFYLNST